MAKLVWDNTGSRFFETGISKVALFVYGTDSYKNGVAWDGVTSLSESPSGAEATDLWADNIKYLTLRSAEEFGFTIEAYQSPKEFDECDGAAYANGMRLYQQTRKMFGLAYTTQYGNDTVGSDYSEMLHLIWGATVSPSERQYQTINDSPEAMTLSWEATTVGETPSYNNGTSTITYKSASHLTIVKPQSDDTNNLKKWNALQDVIYGNAAKNATLPTISNMVGFWETGNNSFLGITT